MNGVPMDQKSLTEEDFEEALLTSLMKETQVLVVVECPLRDREVLGSNKTRAGSYQRLKKWILLMLCVMLHNHI